MRYDGQYRGIVIQNNDPKHEGRVKVFVPGINLQQITQWNQKKEEDKIFKVLGSNTKSDLTKDILQNQKNKLFWAEAMLPIFGMSSPGIYRSSTDNFFIGNDSGYQFQEDDKTPEMVKQDEETAKERQGQPTNPVVDSVNPRTDLNLLFKTLGSKYCCTPPKCPPPPKKKKGGGGGGGGGGATNFEPWDETPNPKYINDTVTPPVIPTLPIEITVPSTIDPTKNKNIHSINLDVVNPMIMMDDVKLDENDPIYTNNCGVVPDIPHSVYAPPILFERVSDNFEGDVADIPINIYVNGRNTLDYVFKYHSSDDMTTSYKSGNLTVVVPNKNVSSITIKANSADIPIDNIEKYFPSTTGLVNPAYDSGGSSGGGGSGGVMGANIGGSIGKIVMPRAPIPRGTKLLSRGGGGGEIYNNVNTKLLDEQKKINSHTGGANNESRYNVNNGRVPLNDPNKTKGANVQSSAIQIHRGPCRAPDYNNDWKGMMSVPGVGSHVWVRFENGDITYPIVVGTYASGIDYKGIYEVKSQ
jgi:hypothetical protein